MGLLRNFFGKRNNESSKQGDVSVPQNPKDSDPRNNPNLIQIFDKYGRELFITKEQWRLNVLPGSIQKNWTNPDVLYTVIAQSLYDGFRADVVDAARQLYKIDPQFSRGACVWGIVLMEEGRLDEAEKVFRDFMAQHGEDGVILTNLAKVFAKRKNETKTEEILWHALEVDSNQDNALAWYEAICRERGGELAGLAALRKIADLPRSWRAQLWLAREALKSNDLKEAFACYHVSLSRVDKPVPADLLMQISGDLGNAGYLSELLQLTQPYFVPEIHGLQVGNNLIKAYKETGQFDEARRILERLYALKRPDWSKSLSFWDTELVKAQVAAANVKKDKSLEMVMTAIDGPIWLKPASPAAELFSVKARENMVISFLGCSAEVIENSKDVQLQMANPPGRMSRALPLYLAEQAFFNTCARVQTLVPWMGGEAGALVLCRNMWKDEDAAYYARQGEVKSDYVIITHLKTLTEPWIVELRLVRTIDGRCLADFKGSFIPARPGDAIPAFAKQMLTLLGQHIGVEPQVSPLSYQVPEGENFSFYMLRLEQLLAVRCGGLQGVNRGFLNGTREILQGNLQLCLDYPNNVCVRILFAQTLLAMEKVEPEVLLEFKEAIALLQKEHPLHEPAHSVVRELLRDVFTEGA